MIKLLRWLGLGAKVEDAEDPAADSTEGLLPPVFHEGQRELLDLDKSILQDGDGVAEQRVQREAQREVQSAAVGTLKKLHVIQMGRCPTCGDHLRQHLFASICESCGWHVYDTPRETGVRVHLRHSDKTMDGDRCYVVKPGAVLVVKNDAVVAKIPVDAYDYIEYLWADDDMQDRRRQALARLNLLCGWCNKQVDPNVDGFHMVQAAFGSTQERYCFCSDDCYEAFRRMYPARVHRDCYNRNCAECNLCTKRYREEADGIQTLAKDYITLKRQEQTGEKHG